ncbi:DUF6456 domain-containing protein [Brevundimonas diminuta]|uniref:DUF6456 domain-containing protein n=1 Tax=Brevundimonas diminuta TaxID=293 RepID=UPI0020974258|nr:DUF6456 domain-containing protein [Brevundimonas diminuta]MCO8017796.1 DUF6456 domain-containing protein [Brevundimonas diminuta]MCO8021316.1 DUF6456 domain-containing protein [Brevundimonas diminuta]
MSRQLERARSLLQRPGAWLDQAGGAYPLRLGGDRRSRVVLTLDEAAFRAVIEQPGLRLREGGGWLPRAANDHAPSSPPPGRPGVIEGERAVMEADGRLTMRRANLGESPILWLARRKDQSGRPWLTPAEVAAGERLRAEAEIATAGPSLTMRWDALPRSGSGCGAGRIEPGDRALSASGRVKAALDACGPRLRAMVEQVCIHGTSLQLAEQALSLRRRQGKTLLKQGLQALAEHYNLT